MIGGRRGGSREIRKGGIRRGDIRGRIMGRRGSIRGGGIIKGGESIKGEGSIRGEGIIRGESMGIMRRGRGIEEERGMGREAMMSRNMELLIRVKMMGLSIREEKDLLILINTSNDLY